jgi:putative ABC transport system permease protein
VLARLRALLRSWLHPGGLDSDLEEELRFHLEREIEVNRAAGLSLAEAERAAHLAVGSLESVREDARRERPGALARQLVRDLGYGTRLLRRAPGFAATCVAIVGLGIASVTATFSVVYGIVLRPLPYAEPQRLVTLWTRAPRLGLARNPGPVCAADYREWRRANDVFEDIALVRPVASFNLVGWGDPERLVGARVSANLFRVLGAVPALGRTFAEGEDALGHERVVLLSQGLWRRRFGADASVVGRRISLSGVPHTVIGVMGAEFDYPGREFQVWTPLTVDPAELARTETPYNYLTVARLRSGVSQAQAQAEMDTIAARLEREFPATNRDVGVSVTGMLDDLVRPVRPALFALFAAVGCVLLMACLNLANLLGARAAARAREFAVRVALGASRARLAVQALAEVAPILALGGALGLVAAAWVVKAALPFLPASLPRAGAIHVDAAALAFASGMILLTGLLAGLAPAVQAWRSGFGPAAREASRSTAGGRGQSRGRRLLVIAQIALAVPLLMSGCLLARSFAALTSVDPGFRAENVVSLHLAIPRGKYARDEDVASLCTRLLERVRTLPGVASAAMVNRLPLSGYGQISSLEFEGREGEPALPVDSRTISDAYFETMGIPVREGRAFDGHDGAAAPPVGIVDEALARRLWPGRTAVGTRFRVEGPGERWVEVVGVVGHLHNDSLDTDARAQVYWPYRQRAQDRMVLVVRGQSRGQPPAAAIVEAIRDVEPDLPAYDVRPMEEVRERSLAARWLGAILVGGFAALSLALASLGVYGVVSFAVARRVREFGIRAALGADRTALTRLVLGEGAALATMGLLFGVGASFLVGRAIQGLLFGVTPRDAASFVIPCVLLLLVVLVASYVPARKAARVDPLVALRHD